MKLSELPIELFSQLLIHLDWYSLVRCKQVCKLLNSVVCNDVALCYKIELGVTGMTDDPAVSTSLQERIEALKRLDFAWNTLTPSKIDKVELMYYPHIYDFKYGIYAQIDATSRNTLRVTSLPSMVNGTELTAHEISFATAVEASAPDNPLVDLLIDPSQDLFIVVKQNPILHTHTNSLRGSVLYTVYCLSLKSGQRHSGSANNIEVVLPPLPQGRFGAACFDNDLPVGSQNVLIAVHREISEGAVSEILYYYVFDWKSGACRFHLLDTRYKAAKLIGSNNDRVITLFFDESTLTFELRLFETSTKDFNSPALLASFGLPQLHSASQVAEFYLKSDPGSTEMKQEGSNAPTKPFFPSRETALMTVNFNVFNEEELEEDVYFSVFLRPQSLLDYLDQSGKSGSSGSQATGTVTRLSNAIPWVEWGPSRTFWEYGDEPSWNDICGQRAATHWPGESGNSRDKFVAIWDFNTASSSRAKVREGVVETYQVDPRNGEVDYPHCFIDPIIFTLCPRALLIRSTRPHTRPIFIDNERILIKKQNDDFSPSPYLEIWTL